MTAHSKLEKEFMIEVQKRLPKCRVFRFDNGTAYAPHTVREALALADLGRPLDAKKALQIISYGNKGWPDLIVGHAGRTIGIEIKIGRDRQSDDQKMMQAAFEKMGWKYVIIRDQINWEELWPLLTSATTTDRQASPSSPADESQLNMGF